MIIVIDRLKLPSVANLREHWGKRAKRAKAHRTLAYLSVPSGIALPAVVRLVRIGPKPLDDDNLAGACKNIRDGIADRLGVEDNDPRVSWQYGQERGKPALRIEISVSNMTCPERTVLPATKRGVFNYAEGE